MPPQKETPRFLGVLGLGALPLLGGGGVILDCGLGLAISRSKSEIAPRDSPSSPNLWGKGRRGWGVRNSTKAVG